MRVALVNGWPMGTFPHMRRVGFYRTRRAFAVRFGRYLFVVEM